MTELNAEQKLAELNAALAKLSPLALKRRELAIEFAQNMIEGGQALMSDVDNPERMEFRFLGRNWYDLIQGTKSVSQTLPQIFLVKGMKAGLLLPTPEDETAIKLEALRASTTNKPAH